MGGLLNNQAAILSGGLSDYITLETLFIAIVVLSVLVLIMIITFFVSVKPTLSGSSAKFGESRAMDSVFEQIVQKEEAELVDDGELVAVITAAIQAYMGDSVPADGFVVRSIRKVNKNRWMNAE